MNCAQCSKTIPKGRRFCSTACRTKWWNENYHKTHKDEMNSQMRERYHKLKNEEVNRQKQIIITKLPLMDTLNVLLLPHDRLEKARIQQEHAKLHGMNTFRLERFVYSAIRCTHCDKYLAVNLPRKLLHPTDSVLLALQKRYKDQPIKLWKVIEHMEKIGKYQLADDITWLYSRMTDSDVS